MVRKGTENKDNNLKTWFIAFQSVLTVAFLIIAFFAQRLVNEIDDLQRQVHQLTVEVSVMKREMEIRNGVKKVNFKSNE